MVKPTKYMQDMHGIWRRLHEYSVSNFVIAYATGYGEKEVEDFNICCEETDDE